MRDEDYELAMKIVIVGNGVVGKSSMIQRFCKGIFTYEYKKTLGVDFLERFVRVKSESIRLMLWDTAGQEEFDAITKAYYRGAQACVIVFSTTDRDSFKSIEKWKKKVEFECGEIPMALVHNKIDLSNESVVKREEIDNLVKRYKWKLFKTSVKDNINVDNVFHFLAESYIDSLNDDYNEEPVLPSHLSLFPNNVANIRSANTGNASITPNPLFNESAGQVSKYKHKHKTDKVGYHYINHGIGLPQLTNNGIVNHYRYKSKFSVIPVSQQSPAILLHRHHQQYQHLIHKHSLHNYHYSTSRNSDKMFKNSFFKTCRIF